MDMLKQFMAGEDRVVVGKWDDRGQVGVTRPKGCRVAY
jgi:hypothetical protein